MGSATRRSIATKATSRTAAAENRPTMRVLPHPSSLPRISASTSRNSELENVMRPAQSTLVAFGSRDSRTRAYEIAIAAMPIGTFRKKIHSHPSESTIAPPTSGPKATARPMVAPYTPMAMPRSRPAGNSWAIMASETANIAAPPTPWTPRAMFRKVGSLASPATSEEIEKIPKPMANTRLRPRRSASEPAVSTTAARVRV